MGILVIEGGRPNGDDLVLGAHHTNPLSIAKAEGKQIVNALNLGDGFVLGGIALTAVFDDAKENLCVVVVAQLGKNSPIVGVRGIPPTVLGEVCRVPLTELRALVATALGEAPVSEVPPA